MNHPKITTFGKALAVLTAREELLAVISKCGGHRLIGIERFELGIFSALSNRRELVSQGLVNLHNADPEKDAFEAMRLGEVIYLLGNTPRGLLQAVYAFEEQMTFVGDPGPNWHEEGVFRFRQRHFHPRFNNWPGERADVSYLSRLGASHCLISHDWQNSLRSLQGYVTSPIFPEAVPAEEVARNNAGLHRLVNDCCDYGLGLSLWLTELPCQGGPWVPESERQAWLDHFSAEVLSDSGTYQGKVLCFSHPQIQAFYRDLLKRFFTEFPEVETIYLFGMDSGGEGCDPETCPRCRGMSKFEQRDRLVRFLAAEGGIVRPGLRVLTTGWHWESAPAEFLERQARLPAASGVYMAAESDGWQAERQNHDFLRRTRAICREQGQLFIGYDDFHLGDDATHLWGLDLQDFPLGIAAKLARWHELEADGVFDHWGAFHEMTPSNSMACREFSLNPLADAEAVCRRLAGNQYGPAAGESAFCAWRSIERAHRILSNCATWHPGQWPNWYKGKSKAPLPENFLQLRKDLAPLVTKPADGFTYNDGNIAECLEAVGAGWRLAAPHLQDAVRHLNSAMAIVEDAPVGYAFWWKGEVKPLTRKEHLARHKIYVEFMCLLGREIGLHFELHALFERLGCNAAAYLAAAEGLISEDLEACTKLVGYIDRLISEYPDAAKLSAGNWREAYRGKLEQLKKHITSTAKVRTD